MDEKNSEKLAIDKIGKKAPLTDMSGVTSKDTPWSPRGPKTAENTSTSCNANIYEKRGK